MPKLLLVPALAAAGLAIGVPVASSARDVTIGDNYFVRPSGVPTVTVSKGTTVRWVWRGRSQHNVKVAQGPVKFGSATKRTGTYSRRMGTRGTYTLICTVHGASDQKMKLVVK